MKHIYVSLVACAIFFTMSAEKCSNTGTTAMDQKASIIGARWNLETIAGKAFQLPEGIEDPYISIGPDSQLNGFGGCNKIMGAVKLDGSSLSFPGLASTKMMCPAASTTESGFMSALRSTNTFKLEGDKLTLLDKGKELATLVKGK